MKEFDNIKFSKLDENEIMDYMRENGSIIPYVSPFNDYLVIDFESKQKVDMSQENAKKLYMALSDYIKNFKYSYSKVI